MFDDPFTCVLLLSFFLLTRPACSFFSVQVVRDGALVCRAIKEKGKYRMFGPNV